MSENEAATAASHPSAESERIANLLAQIERLKAVPAAPPAGLKLDLGCGKNKQPGFLGVDKLPFPGVDVVGDIGITGVAWPWPNDSVDEVWCSHFLEHLEAAERVHFFNELHRVLRKGGKATITTPHWASCRAYGDLTHKWPPVTEFFWPYLNAAWRDVNAPHSELTCDFDTGYGYTMRADLVARNDEYRTYALANFKEAAQDMQATVIARK